MSGVHGQVFGHLVRRGMSAAQVHLNEAGNPGGEHEKEVVINFDPQEYLPAMIVFLITALLYASVRYTLGEVVASLAMIESPSSTAIIESRPQKYADEPDAPLEKEKEAMMMPAEATADQDVEITVINHKPISAKISTSIRHLHNVGGFFGRWRGAGVCAVYHFLHGLSTNLLSNLMGFGIAGHALTHIFFTVCLARLHMAWTHAMIAAPKSDNKIWFRRMVPRKQCKALLLPSLACAVAQQITIIMPIGVAFAFGLPDQMHNQEFDFMNRDIAPSEASYYAFALLAVPLTAVFVALAILLPASVTLTRIEAALLPEDQDTIVPFDKSAVLGDFDLQARGACRKIFVEAWKSFEPAARLRLIKLYVKMASIQVFIVVMGFVAAMFLM